MPYADQAKQIEYQIQWMKRRRDTWFAENGPCVDCGSNEGLQLDHVDPKLKITHRVWSWSDARRLAELAKCVARCKSCHLDKSRAEGSLSTQRGTRSRAAKLDDDKVREVRRRYADGERLRDLAAEFGVCHQKIHDVVRRRCWKHVD